MTIFRSGPTARVCRGQFKFEKHGRKFSKWIENTVGKGEIARYVTVFSEDLNCRHVKTRACLGKGLSFQSKFCH